MIDWGPLPFEIKTPRRPVRGEINIRKLEAQREEENLPTSFQGEPVDSIPEARLGVALQILHIPFAFHYSVFGGQSIRGGQVVDFLAYLHPKARPVFMLGRYWHGFGRLGITELQMQWLWHRTSGYWGRPVGIWDYEVPTIDAAVAVALRELGRG